MQDLTEWMGRLFDSGSTLQAGIVGSLVVILVLWLLRLVAMYVVRRHTEDVRIRYRWRKASAYLAAILGVALIGWIWLERIQSVATFLGLLSAGVTIALREPLINLAGWIFILWRRPFEVSDRIQIGEHTGDVIDVRIFQFTLLEIGNWVAADQSTGRIIHVPNGRVFGDPLINYSKGFGYIWNEVPVRVTFESDWEKAKALLQEIANRHAAYLSADAKERVRQAARRFMIVYSALTPIVYARVEANGVLLTVRYLCEVRRRRSSEAAIWEDVLRAFAQHAEVEFAYPTQRFYSRRTEGPQRVGRSDEGLDATRMEDISP